MAAPFLGCLSDRYGRRPVLIISIAGNWVGFIIFALASNLVMLFLARALAGVTGGNISDAQAYIADVTKPEERAMAADNAWLAASRKPRRIHQWRFLYLKYYSKTASILFVKSTSPPRLKWRSRFERCGYLSETEEGAAALRLRLELIIGTTSSSVRMQRKLFADCIK